jgi:GNAT superfamily N-acetyltransferase
MASDQAGARTYMVVLYRAFAQRIRGTPYCRTAFNLKAKVLPVGYSILHRSAPQVAPDSSTVASVASIFSHSFGTNEKTGRPYYLSAKKTRERLEGTNDLFLAIEHATNTYVGYVYGRTIDYDGGIVVWIDSLAVLPAHRRKGLGTGLVRNLIGRHSLCRWVGCATPNPVAAFVIARATGGRAFAGECNPPQELVRMIESIRGQTPDLQGADFNAAKLLVRTKFNPTSTGDSKDWSPPHPSEPPPWWGSLANLPSDHEALLIIDRHAEG